MKSQDLIKWVVGIIAAYLGYKWAVEQGHITDSLNLLGGATPVITNGDPAGAPAVENGNGGGAHQSNGGGGGQQTPQPPPTGGGNGAGATNGGGGGGNTSGGAGSNVPPGGSGGGGDLNESVANAVRAARAAMGKGADLQMNYWNWNFYLPANVAKLDPFAIPSAAWKSATGADKPQTVAQMQGMMLTSEQWYHLSKGMWGLGGMGAINHWGQRASIRTGTGWVN